jgi:uncharacterized membrane protein
VLTAVVAFGPTFAFGVIAGMAAREPQHGLFALRLTERIERRIVLPAALTMPISGGLLVWSESIQLTSAHWLLMSIVLYVLAIAFAVGIQVRTIDRMIEVAERMTAAGPVFAAGPGAELARPATVVARGNATPADELAELGIRARNGGILLMVMVVVIVSLMAGKPTI